MQGLAHLVLVDNPAYHPHGDFCLANQKISLDGDKKFYFCQYWFNSPALFRDCTAGKFRLAMY